jgi:hypothetical protein
MVLWGSNSIRYLFNKAVFSLTGYCNHKFNRMGHDDIGGKYKVFKECKVCTDKHYLT